MLALFVTAALMGQVPTPTDAPPTTTEASTAETPTATASTPPPPLAEVSPPADATPAPAPAADPGAAEREARERRGEREQVVNGVVVANLVSYTVLMGAGATVALFVPQLALVGLALPVLGVPLALVATAWAFAPEGQRLASIGGTVAGHYGGLLLGTLGGAAIGAVGGMVLIFPVVFSSGGSGDLGTAILLLLPFATGALGGLVGAGVGGAAGSGIGAHMAMSLTE